MIWWPISKVGMKIVVFSLSSNTVRTSLTETVHSLDIFHASKYLNESCKSAPHFLTPRSRRAFWGKCYKGFFRYPTKKLELVYFFHAVSNYSAPLHLCDRCWLGKSLYTTSTRRSCRTTKTYTQLYSSYYVFCHAHVYQLISRLHPRHQPGFGRVRYRRL